MAPAPSARPWASSPGTLTATLQRALRAGLDWAAIQVLSDAELEARMHPPLPSVGTSCPEPDWPRLHLELRKKGVTLERLNQEHLEQYPDGLRRSVLLAHYRQWVKARGPVMRQTHLGGDKLFVDSRPPTPTRRPEAGRL